MNVAEDSGIGGGGGSDERGAGGRKERGLDVSEKGQAEDFVGS